MSNVVGGALPSEGDHAGVAAPQSDNPGERALGGAQTAVAMVRQEIPLLLAVLVGLMLRLHQITGQIIADDEWHALNALLRLDYRQIIGHFGDSDISIPLTLYFKAAADTIGLTEMVMRAPMLVAGGAALIVLPLMTRPHVGRLASNVFVWLLAVSPLHVYFSRFARPYSITLLLSVVAVLAFYLWWKGGRQRWAWLYAAAAILAPYLHLSVLPFVLAPLLFGAGYAVLRRSRAPRSLGALAQVGGAVAVGLGVLLAPPIIADLGAITGKSGVDAAGLATFAGAGKLFAGTSSVPLTLAIGLLVVAGWSIALVRNREMVAFLTFIAACQVAVALLTRPAAIQEPIVFARYVLPLLPLALLYAAVGIAWVEGAVARHSSEYPRGATAAALIVILFVAGPIPPLYGTPNNWMNHAMFQYRYTSGDLSWYNHTRPHRIPPIYQYLSTFPPGSLLIVEAPWHYAWHENPYPFYQAIHKQRMAIGFSGDPAHWTRPGELPRGAGVRFRNAVHLTDVEAIVERGANLVILHRSLRDEYTGRNPEKGPEYRPTNFHEYIEGYRTAFGEPAYEDEDVVVFAVDGMIDVAAAEAAIMHNVRATSVAAPDTTIMIAEGGHGGLECMMDWINGEPTRSGGNVVDQQATLRLSGWLVDHSTAAPPASVTVLLSDSRRAFSMQPRWTDRPDVAAHFGEPRFVRSGVAVEGLLDALPPGRYDVLIRVVRGAGGETALCSTGQTIEVIDGL